jgi:hypothetical protein
MGAYRAVLVAAALFGAAACSDNSAAPTPVTPTSPSAPGGAVASVIAVVSGNDQRGKAGEQLVDPFVVRVTDRNGNG